jgi:hypothetical protein
MLKTVRYQDGYTLMLSCTLANMRCFQSGIPEVFGCNLSYGDLKSTPDQQISESTKSLIC